MRAKLTWTAAAWTDYVYWQGQDRKALKRVHQLLQELLRHPETGIGKPEPPRANLAGFWSRRIDDTHRLVYAIEDERIVVIACRYHYE